MMVPDTEGWRAERGVGVGDEGGGLCAYAL
jgi:hypothetical protein